MAASRLSSLSLFFLFFVLLGCQSVARRKVSSGHGRALVMYALAVMVLTVPRSAGMAVAIYLDVTVTEGAAKFAA